MSGDAALAVMEAPVQCRQKRRRSACKGMPRDRDPLSLSVTGSTAQLHGQLELPFVDLGIVASTSRTRGTDPRPVAVPDDVDDPRHVKAAGVVRLPSNVRWSGPPKTYDLDDPIDLARVYEQVLREGTEDDVRHFIDVDVLEKLWDAIVVPARVRTAWAAWFRRHRGVDLAC